MSDLAETEAAKLMHKQIESLSPISTIPRVSLDGSVRDTPTATGACRPSGTG
jgi:hypothetical protein